MAELLSKIPTNLTEYPNSFKRQGCFPLEAYSVFYTSFEEVDGVKTAVKQTAKAAAENYAATNGIAYVGQTVATVETRLDGTIASVEFWIIADAAGTLEQVGSATAGDDKSITLVDGVLSITGFKAASTDTLPSKAADGSINWITVDSIVQRAIDTKTVVVAGEESDITVTPNYDEASHTYTYTLDLKLPEPVAVPEYTVTKETSTGKTTYKVTKDGVQAGEAIEVPNAYDDSALASRVSSAEATIEEHTTGIQELNDRVNTFFGAAEDADTVVNTLKEIQDYITSDESDTTTILSDIAANKTAIETLNGDATKAGSVAKQIADHVQIADGKYATKAEVADVSAVAAAAVTQEQLTTALAAKANTTDITNNYYDKDAIDAKLDGIKGEYGETADSVADDLRTHVQESTSRFNTIDAKQSEQDDAIEANAEAIEANVEAIEANTAAIDAINDQENGILAQAKAAAKADAAQQVASLKQTHDSEISQINSQISDITTNATNLAGEVSTVKTKVGLLEQGVTENQSAHETFTKDIGANTNAISDLKLRATKVEQDVANNAATLAGKADTSYVDSEITKVVNNLDRAGLVEDIEANTSAIETEVTRATNKENELAELITANDKAIKANDTAIKANAQELARIDGVIVAAINGDNTAFDSIKELADWISKHDTEVLPVVNANTAAIEKLNGDKDIEGSVAKAIADAISEIPAVPLATMLQAGIVKGSDEVTVTNGVLGLGNVSTDKLVQGTETLVLHGGTSVEG